MFFVCVLVLTFLIKVQSCTGSPEHYSAIAAMPQHLLGVIGDLAHPDAPVTQVLRHGRDLPLFPTVHSYSMWKMTQIKKVGEAKNLGI